IVASPGCGAPNSLFDAIAKNPLAIEGSTLYSGLLLGDYPFLPAVEEGLLRYATWHVMPAVRDLVASGVVPFHPVRASQVPALLRDLKVDTALIRVAPPDRHGFCNLGPSVSYPIGAVRLANLVVAEFDETAPRVYGEAAVHVSEIDVAIDAFMPMSEYRRAEGDETSRAIARHILELLPESPVVQIGIGSIPEALLDELRAAGRGDLRFAGMAVDGIADLYDSGLLARAPLHPYPPVVAAELMGSARLMEFADGNPVIGNFSTGIAIDGRTLGQFDRFVSINSAVEVDRYGQVNSEWASGRQLSGVGGSVDFFEAAANSSGGCRILAMAAANVRDASSKIVGALKEGVPVTIPRHSVDYVVTEFGVARLDTASVRERADRLAEVAAPDHRTAIVAEVAVL
ncbi:MAG TPA: acetyl-CoA hydrolase/transferase C-terminal domain-containing protein, partial [Gaiellaceae bacterium]|nr:acetyl-CoA hydrolase/transferase C-terminal domain-containing protein [Gaiellaceae bacterium]